VYPVKAEQHRDERAISHPGRRIRWIWERVGWWILAPLVTLCAYAGVSDFQFVADARFLILENLYITDLSYLWDTLTHNYFWSSSGSVIPYWRPVTKLSWLLEYQAFGTWAGGYLLVQVGWHLAGVAGVQMLARHLGSGRCWAMTAGLLFGLHPVAIEPVSLLMARSDVVAASSVVWAILGFLRWRSGPWWVVIHLLATALALGSKESSVMVAVVLSFWVLLQWGFARRAAGVQQGSPSSISGQVLRLALVWSLVGAYLVTRSATLRADTEGLPGVSLSMDPLRILASSSMYLQNLLPFQLGSSIRNIPLAEAQSPLFLLTAAGVALCLGLLLYWLVRREDYIGSFLLLWACLALAPVILSGQISVPAVDNKYPLADRWLFHSLAAAMLLSVHLLQQVRRVNLNRVLLPGAAVWAVAVIWSTAEMRAEYRDERSLVDYEDRAVFFATPARFRTRQDRCRFLDRQFLRADWRNERQAALAIARRAVKRCGNEERLRLFHLFTALVALNHYHEAEPQARQLLEHPPRAARAHGRLALLAGEVFLHTGKPGLARQWLVKARKLGLRSCKVEQGLARAALALGHPRVAALQLEAAFRCGNERNPDVLITAGLWWIYAGRADLAEGIFSLLRKRFSLSPQQAARVEALRATIKRMRGAG